MGAGSALPAAAPAVTRGRGSLDSQHNGYA